MHRLPTFALLCVLLPLAGLAQAPPPSPAPDAPVAAPPLVSAPEEEEPGPLEPGETHAEPEGMPPVPRVILESLASGTGMLTGGLLGIVLSVSTSSCHLFEGDCATLIIFGLGGMALGSAGATYLAGSLMKGRGGFLGSLLGSTVGTGMGLLMLLTLKNDNGLGTISLLAMPTFGAVLGYELSGATDFTRFSLTGTRESSPVTPIIGRTPEGGLMGGLMGRF